MLSLVLEAAMTMQSADTLFVNDRVYVQMGRFETALAVAGDKALAMGDDATVLSLVSSTTRVVDLAARLVTPVDLTMMGGSVVFERTPRP